MLSDTVSRRLTPSRVGNMYIEPDALTCAERVGAGRVGASQHAPILVDIRTYSALKYRESANFNTQKNVCTSTNIPRRLTRVPLASMRRFRPIKSEEY
jgi:hypothetical protein